VVDFFKSWHGSVLLTLQQQEQHISDHGLLSKVSVLLLLQALEKAEAAELAKLHAAHTQALEQRDVQMQQLEELKQRILAER
jgi:hypothetical protein